MIFNLKKTTTQLISILFISILLISTLLISTLSTTTFASANGDFDQADQLFAERAQGEATVLQAQAAYKKLLSKSQGADQLYAASQIARLSYYHGEVLTSRSEKDKRVSIFKSCADDIEIISPKKYGQETEAYYNWKLTCVTLWMESGRGLTSSQYRAVGNDLKTLIKKSLEFTTNDNGDYVGTYEGGAIARYVAAIYSNPNARAIGLYKPREALILINAATEADYHDSRAYPEPLSGEDYAENSFVMVKVLRENKKNSEATEYLNDAIEGLEDQQDSDELPVGRESEALHQLARLKTL
jgi:hypothetical protein